METSGTMPDSMVTLAVALDASLMPTFFTVTLNM